MIDKDLNEIRKYLLINLGLNFTKTQESELYKKISDASNDFNFKDTDKFIKWLLNTTLDHEQIEKLASHLTIGETYFLREIKALNFLENVYLPTLIKERKGRNKSLRIWCAGCASGEEPYSISIMLNRIIPDIKNWNINILATDINAKFLEKARKGIYTKWSFRKLPESFKKQYFTEVEKDRFQIKPQLQQLVTFNYQNLATDSYPSLINNTNAMDIILCRNVLIYFSEEGIAQVTNRMYNSLIPGGVFIVSPVEMSGLISSKFGKLNYLGYTFYTKETHKNKLKKGESKSGYNKTDGFKEPKAIVQPNEAGVNIKDNKSLIMLDNIQNMPKFKLPLKRTISIQQALECYEQGLYEKTEDILINESKEQSNSEDELKLLIKAEANLGKLDSAIELCKKALKTNKLSVGIYYLLATIQQEQGSILEAMESLKRVLFINSDFPLAHFTLGNLNKGLGRQKTALKHYENSLQIAKKYKHNELLEEADGLTAGRLVEIIKMVK